MTSRDGNREQVSLDRALRGLPGDRATENVVRDVVEFMSTHAGRHFTGEEIADAVKRPEHTVQVILSKLAEGYVLRSDGNSFRYDRDPVLELDVQRFLRRSGQHSQLAQDNLARFRDRYGYR